MKKKIAMLLMFFAISLFVLIPSKNIKAEVTTVLSVGDYVEIADIYKNSCVKAQSELSEKATGNKKNAVKELNVISKLYKIFGKYTTYYVDEKKLPSGYKYEGCKTSEQKKAVKWAISHGIVDPKTFKANAYAKRALTIEYFYAAIKAYCPEIVYAESSYESLVNIPGTAADHCLRLGIIGSNAKLKNGYTSKKDLSKMEKNTKVILKNLCDVIKGDYPVIETEHCFILVDEEHVDLPKNFAEVIEEIIVMLEKETGLPFEAEYNILGSEHIKSYLGANPWQAFNRRVDKLKIFITSDFKEYGWISVAAKDCCILIMEDLLDENSNFDWYAPCHELSHVIFERNSGPWGRKMAEGNGMFYGQYLAKKLAKTHPEYTPGINTRENYYGLMEEDITAATAKDIFLYGKNDTIKEYQYGLYLYTYLNEIYGNKWIANYVTEINKREFDWSMVSTELEAKTLEKCFGKDFFKKFGNWLEKNKSRFE